MSPLACAIGRPFFPVEYVRRWSDMFRLRNKYITEDVRATCLALHEGQRRQFLLPLKPLTEKCRGTNRKVY